MRKRFIYIMSFLLLGTFGVVGCAAIFHGTKDDVKFSSKPEQCEVWIDGEYRGITPLKLTLKSDKEYNVEIKKSGFTTYTARITNGLAGGYIVLDVLFTGLLGIIVDAATGSWITLDQTNINAILIGPDGGLINTSP
jgi:hypothetical protein